MPRSNARVATRGRAGISSVLAFLTLLALLAASRAPASTAAAPAPGEPDHAALEHDLQDLRARIDLIMSSLHVTLSPTPAPTRAPTSRPTSVPSAYVTALNRSTSVVFGTSAPTPTAVYFGPTPASPDRSGLTRAPTALGAAMGDSWIVPERGVYAVRCNALTPVFTPTPTTVAVAYLTRNATSTSLPVALTAATTLSLKGNPNSQAMVVNAFAVLERGDELRCHVAQAGFNLYNTPWGLTVVRYPVAADACDWTTNATAVLTTYTSGDAAAFASAATRVGSNPSTTALTFGSGLVAPSCSPSSSSVVRAVNPADGDTFTAARAGVYALRATLATAASASASNGTARTAFVTRNAPSTQPSMPPFDLLLAANPMLATPTAAPTSGMGLGTLSWVGWLDAGDRVRVHAASFQYQVDAAGFYGVSTAYVATDAVATTRMAGEVQRPMPAAGANATATVFSTTWTSLVASANASGVVRQPDPVNGDKFVVPATGMWIVTFAGVCGGTLPCNLFVARNVPVNVGTRDMSSAQLLAMTAVQSNTVGVAQYVGPLDAGDAVVLGCWRAGWVACEWIAGTGASGMEFALVQGRPA